MKKAPAQPVPFSDIRRDVLRLAGSLGLAGGTGGCGAAGGTGSARSTRGAGDIAVNFNC